MAFALQEVELWNYVTGVLKMPCKLSYSTIGSSKKIETQLEKQDAQNMEQLMFKKKQQRVLGKKGKMCIDNVLQKFLSMRNLANSQAWDPKNFWIYLKD